MYSKKGEMGQAREKPDKTWVEVGQMRLFGFSGRTAPDSVVAATEVPQQVQTGSKRGRQFSYSTAGSHQASTGKDYPRQGGGSPNIAL